MAKTAVINRDQKRRLTVKKYAKRRAELLAIIRSAKASDEDRVAARRRLEQLPRDSSPTRSHNRCQLTGRSKAVYRKFKVSRIMLRELALAGKIPGLKKASW